MTILKHTNRAFSLLASGIDDDDLALSVTPTEGAKFPALGTFNVTIFKPATPDTGREIVAVTARTGDVFTITRGAEGTTPVAHDAGDYVWLDITSGVLDGLETEIGLKMATASDAAAAVAAMGVLGDANPLNHNKYTHPNHSGDVMSTGDGATAITGLALSKLAAQAADSVVANVTDGSAVPGAYVVDEQEVLGRITGGRLKGLSAAELLALAGAAPASGIALSALATQAAQTVLANATDGAAAPTAVVIAASQLVARLAAGNIKGISTTEAKTLLAYLTDLIDDTTPQLGGDLDANAKKISALLSLDFSDFAVLTIATGAVTVTQTCHTLTAQADNHPVDDLDTINGGTNGMVIFIKPTAGDDITVKHHTGNIWLKGAADILLDEDSDLLQLVYDGAHWCDVGGPSGASTTVATDPIWAAAGDVAVATANDTAGVVNLTEQTVLGRITAGAVKALSAAELLTLSAALPLAGGTPTGDILLNTLITGEYHDYGHDATVTLVPGDYRLMKQTLDANTAFTITDPGVCCTFELWLVHEASATLWTPTWTGGSTHVVWLGDGTVPSSETSGANVYIVFKRVTENHYLAEWSVGASF